MDQVDLNKLWQNFTDTITNHYSDLNGRVGRAQYWYYILVYVIVGVLISLVSSFMFFAGALSTLYSLALLLPTIGMTARRLQDTGRPGTWAWILAIPIGYSMVALLFSTLMFGPGSILYLIIPFFRFVAVGAILVLIISCAQPGQSDANQYGPAPPPWPPAGSAPQGKT